MTLDAPTGMAIVGDELYVADIDTLHVFDANVARAPKMIPVEKDP